MIDIEIIEEAPTMLDLDEGIFSYRYLYFACPKCNVLNTRRIKNVCQRSFDSIMGRKCYNCYAEMPDMERVRDQRHRRLSYHRTGT